MENQNHNHKENVTLIKLDIWSILKIVLIVLGLWILYFLRDVILIVLIAGLLAAIINPIVNFFEKKKIPRLLGAAFVYLGVLAILILIALAIIPAVAEQGQLFVDQIPNLLKTIFNKVEPGLQANSGKEFSDLLTNWFERSSFNTGSFLSVVGGVAGQVVSFFMVFILAFYMSVRKKCLTSFVESITPQKYKEFLKNFMESVQSEIGAWARGLLLLCLFVGSLAYLGLLVLGVKFSLTLAMIAGLTEVIPYLGPWIGAIPAILIAFTQSPTLGLLTMLLYLIIQQVENAFVSPYVMHRAVGLDPLVIVLALIIGGKIAGPIGMILAVPAATIISILNRYYCKYKQKVVEN